ncbi:MAG: hypothetical protein Q8859_12170, partial [Bacteroidota bacterium]|nr:hypothetical protein [Bacteroidota bacterium]
MNKSSRIIISGIIALAICYFADFIFMNIKYGYHIELCNPKPYLWIFKDSARNDIDPNCVTGCIRKKDALYIYYYKKEYNIAIWEFKDLHNAKLKNITIKQNVDLENLKFESGEILNRKCSPEYTIKYGPLFDYGMDINLDKDSKIDKSFETSKYKGFCGSINKMSFSNEKGKHLVLVNYVKGIKSVLFLLYKSKRSLYVIIIQSDKPFDEKI